MSYPRFLFDMNKRLNCILSLIPDGKGVIDVGTDHGYLPVALIRRGYPGRVYASDIRSGPLSAARQSAQKAGLEGRIEFLLCDGLEGCDPNAVDTIVIAGMGGDTICGILDRAEWCMDKRYTLVLQPMTRAEVLRYWLVYNEFAILKETLVEDGGILYSVLTAQFGGNTKLSDAELFTGSFESLRAQPLFRDFLELQIQRFEHMLAGLEQAQDAAPPGRQCLLQTILSELKEERV